MEDNITPNSTARSPPFSAHGPRSPRSRGSEAWSTGALEQADARKIRGSDVAGKGATESPRDSLQEARAEAAEGSIAGIRGRKTEGHEVEKHREL